MHEGSHIAGLNFEDIQKKNKGDLKKITEDIENLKTDYNENTSFEKDEAIIREMVNDRNCSVNIPRIDSRETYEELKAKGDGLKKELTSIIKKKNNDLRDHVKNRYNEMTELVYNFLSEGSDEKPSIMKMNEESSLLDKSY